MIYVNLRFNLIANSYRPVAKTTSISDARKTEVICGCESTDSTTAAVRKD